jgi:type III restriction enzyme
MEMLDFQIEASEKIAKRFQNYKKDPLFISQNKKIPFYQQLSAITGSGKTLILIETINLIRFGMNIEPIILWVSKGSVVVQQTFDDISNGKYLKFATNFNTKLIGNCKKEDINENKGLILMTTSGKFNIEQSSEDKRKIYDENSLDYAYTSLWNLLKIRNNYLKEKRPLIIVYDEGHNLSDQETKRLLELEPDAIITASATMKVPKELEYTINRLKKDKEWSNDDFITKVNSRDAIDEKLIKREIIIGGYVTEMEVAIDNLIEKYKKLKIAAQYELEKEPKIIYVTDTNKTLDKEMDNKNATFDKRKARPIEIWKYLVNVKKINPTEIAVYSNLEFSKEFPPPNSFKLYRGEKDFEKFKNGNYKHIIFNLTLQEGWDDPYCYFAYIDKEMYSSGQIKQVIGRVLRQPEKKYYKNEDLNTAHFFVRSDEKKTIESVVNELEDEIKNNSPDVKISSYKFSPNEPEFEEIEPKFEIFLPDVSIDSSESLENIKLIIENMHDYSTDKINTIGKGSVAEIKKKWTTIDETEIIWKEFKNSNKVSARWIFIRELSKKYKKALNLCDIENKKFDVQIEFNSKAEEEMKNLAEKVANEYINSSKIVINNSRKIPIDKIKINSYEKIEFKNSIHKYYSDFNAFELEFAKSLDKVGLNWLRNKSRLYFELPLLSLGKTKNFNPDFVVWKDDDIFVIDTKGDHLIVEEAGKKIFYIENGSNHLDGRIKIVLLTRGKWDDNYNKESQEGYAVWKLINGKVKPKNCDSIQKAIKECLK